MRYPSALSTLPLYLALAGCQGGSTASAITTDTPDTTPARVRDIYAGQPEVVRYDRYTLVSTAPASAQRDLLNQMTDIRMPPDTVKTIGDALRYTLMESGYTLCPAQAGTSVLYSRSLPSVQRHLGPVRLAEALQLLAGPAWQIQVDQVLRQICFTLRPGFKAPSLPTSALAATTTATLSVSDIVPKLPLLSPATPSTSPAPAIIAQKIQTTAAATPAPLKHIDVVRLNTDTIIPDWTPQGSGKATLPVLLKRVLPAGWSSILTPELQKQQTAKVLSWKGDRDWRLILDDLARDNHWRITLNPDTRAITVAPMATQAVQTAPATVPAKSVSTPAVPSAPAVARPTTALPPAPAPTPAQVAQPIPAPKPVITPVWKAEPGTSLREFLTQQAATVDCAYGGHWAVIWPVNVDYPISARLVFHGSFDSLLDQVFRLYSPGRVDTPLYAQGNRSQCVVRVTDKPGDK